MFMSVYASTADSKEKDKDRFRDTLAKAVEEEKGSFMYIGGDFNARLYERQAHEKEELGERVLERKE